MCRWLNMKIWYPILLVLHFEIGLERLTIDLWSNLPNRGENRHINKKWLQSHIPYMQKFIGCVRSDHVFNLHSPFYVESVRQK